MLRLIQFLISGHIHEWGLHKEGQIVDKNKNVIGHWYHLYCKKCGEMKKEAFKP